MLVQAVFNVDLGWSVLCPFKLVAYTTKKAPKDVTVVIVRPTYIMEKDTNKKAKDRNPGWKSFVSGNP